MALVGDRECELVDSAPLNPRRGRKRLTLVVVSLGVMMVGIDGSVVSIANPYIARDLHASLADLQWVTNAYLLALAVLLIVGGKLGDRYGRRRMFLIGVVGFAIASVAIGLVGSITGVIAFRVLQGAFGALLMPNTLALLRSAYPEDELTQAVGVWGSAAGAATAAGPILGGLLVDNVSWQSVFYLNVPVAIATVALGVPFLLESRESHRTPLDWPGVLTLAAGLSALIFGLVKAQEWTWGSPRTLGLLAAAVALLLAFVVVESRVASPLLPLWLFKDRSVSFGSAGGAAEFLRPFRGAVLRLPLPAERLGILGTAGRHPHPSAHGLLLDLQPAGCPDHPSRRTPHPDRRRVALGVARPDPADEP